MNLHLITGNKNKVEEFKSIVPEIEQLDIDLTEIQDIDPHKVITEKLNEAVKQHGGTLLVEDTSLTLSGMNGLPGPLIKWFLKTIGNEGITKLSKVFGSKAQAKVIIGYINEAKEIKFFEGSIEGEIVDPRGEKGFGWDPIFQPNESNKTFAEMDLDEKNKFSMRRIAIEKLNEFLMLQQ